MTLRNALEMGSQTALSMAANPVAATAMLTAAGVSLTIGAAAWGYHVYTAYEEKKHRKEIEDINKLHKNFLEKIVVAEYNDIQGFPPVFKLTPGEKSTSVDSMHFTDDQIKDIGKTTPHGIDISLYKYRELILNAINELKTYYLDRDEPKDITAGVLSYLMYILESKCLNFAGYEYDIAYLNALSKFINAYASSRHTKNSQHFSRLSPVYGYINDALQELQKHKESLSLTRMISDLSECCLSESKKMIKTFVKLITPEKNWKYVDMAVHDELAQGKLRRGYVHTEIIGLKVWSDPVIDMLKSNFQDWLNFLLKYFEESINPASPMTINDIKSPEELFIIPDLSKLPSKNHKGKNDEAKKNQALLKSIRHVFNECENYITMKLDPKTELTSPEFIHITEDEELVARTKILASFAALTHQMISLQYLSVYLLKSIKQLGEIYVKNPRHFTLIFNVVMGLCNKIIQSIENHQKEITAIQQQNKNTMQLEAQELFPQQTLDMLNTTHATISKLSRSILDFRNKVAANYDSLIIEKESVKHEMFEVAGVLAEIYNMRQDTAADLSHSTNSTADDSESLPDDQSKTPKSAPNNKHKIIDGAIESTKSGSEKTQSYIKPEPTFWQKHKYKILAAIFISAAILCAALAVIIAFFSAGTLTPASVMMVGLGMKIGVAGAAFIGINLVLGSVISAVFGAIVGSAVAAADTLSNTCSSHFVIHRKLKKYQRDTCAMQPRDDEVVIAKNCSQRSKLEEPSRSLRELATMNNNVIFQEEQTRSESQSESGSLLRRFT